MVYNPSFFQARAGDKRSQKNENNKRFEHTKQKLQKIKTYPSLTSYFVTIKKWFK